MKKTALYLPAMLLLLPLSPQAQAPLPAPTATPLAVPAGLDWSPFNVPRTLQVPAGFRVAVYARVPGARFMALTPDGNLLVSQPYAGKVSLVRPGSGGGPPVVTDFVTGLRYPHDLVFHVIGSTTYLYLSESNQINRYTYTPGDLTAQNRQVIITGLPDASSPELGGQYGHQLKNIALGPDHKLYVSIASTCNVCVSDATSDPIRNAVYQYNPDGTNRRLFARGLRNAEGLAFVPGTNTLWVTVNSRDNTPYPFNDGTGRYGQVIPSYVDNHPPDLFTQVRDGGDYGWPYANSNPDSPSGLDDMPLDLDYDTNRDGTVPLSRFDRASKGIQAHSAALGLAFLQGTAFPATYGPGVTIALHGSWNRTTRTGYKVIYFPWDATAQRPGAQADLVTGFLDASGNAWGRPVDVAVDPQGRLLISDDQSGTIYALTAPAAPLPVALTSFQAAAQGDDAQLTWTTASEQRNARFEVERSLDGQTYGRVGTVPGHGSAAQPQAYTWRDIGAARLGPALYYRLRQVDEDGTARYSAVQVVRFGPAPALARLYPDPAGPASATLDLSALPPGPYQVDVLDAVGRAVLPAQAVTGGAWTLPTLPPGLYLVRVRGAGVSQVLRLEQE